MTTIPNFFVFPESHLTTSIPRDLVAFKCVGILREGYITVNMIKFLLLDLAIRSHMLQNISS